MTTAEKNDLLKGLMSLLSIADAPAKSKGKRTLSDEQKAKMAAGRKKAAAAKGTPAVKAATATQKKAPAREEFGGMAFGEGSVGKRSRKVSVPFYFDGEYAGSIRADLARKVFLAIRGAAAGDMLAHIELQAEQA